MSASQLLVIACIALVVFGPKKLPMLATHLGLCLKLLNKFKQQAQILWQQMLLEQQLEENKKKALEADKTYEQDQKDKR